ncbi:MAG: type VI secretion system domain-containing protein, partial [Myxococcales bacterium]|nr:type VI secretion system domain-containing protein [Myxococcales bacterium]
TVPAAPVAAPAPVDTPPMVSAPATVSADVAVSADDVQGAMKKSKQVLVDIARVIRTGKPEDPRGVRFNRLGAWLMLEKAPPATDGKTLVPAPPPNIGKSLDALAKNNDWLNLLGQSETQMSKFIMWLDLQRLSATAMGALGALFMEAKNELLLHVALLLRRIPTLPDLAFSDGTPFADGATKMWIESDVMPVLASGGGGGGGGGGGLSAAMTEAISEAKDFAVKGELGKALEAMTTASGQASSPAERFRGQLVSAQLCLGGSQYAIARSQLEGLAAEIERHHLTSWDPGLCAEVYGGLFSALKALNDARRPKPGAPKPAGPGPAVPPEDEAAERLAFERLCQLDPAAALKLGGS